MLEDQSAEQQSVRPDLPKRPNTKSTSNETMTVEYSTPVKDSGGYRSGSGLGSTPSDPNVQSPTGSTGSGPGSINPGGAGLSPSTNNQNQNKSTRRRPHNKSRRGCLNCKRRRVKCDETHPICKNCEHLALECSFSSGIYQKGMLNLMDIRLFYNYTTEVWPTITAAGISNEQIWGKDVPLMSFEYPFLMHAILTFSATHFTHTHRGVIDQVVTFHRNDALRLLAEAVQNVTPQNLDPLVAASILLILDALANASSPESSSASSLPASAWLHHVRGAATILTAIGPCPPESRFHRLVNIDLSDLAQGVIIPMTPEQQVGFSLVELECFDDELKDLYPVKPTSPYFNTLIYLDKLLRQRYKSDFILRVFSFPALLDRSLIMLLDKGDKWAKRIIKVYYKLVRSFTSEMKDSVWFLEGVARILPIDMDAELGGLGFITSALPVIVSLKTEEDEEDSMCNEAYENLADELLDDTAFKSESE